VKEKTTLTEFQTVVRKDQFDIVQPVEFPPTKMYCGYSSALDLCRSNFAPNLGEASNKEDLSVRFPHRHRIGFEWEIAGNV
jgi:hypothetical protein